MPKSLRLKKPKKFKVPNISRREIDKSLGRAGKYDWVVEDDAREVEENDGNKGKISKSKNTKNKSQESPDVPFYLSSSRVTMNPKRNMYE